MKSSICILAVLFISSESLALAEDFKTINGKEYKDATVMRVEMDGVVLRTKTGISKVYFAELPKDVQEKFHYVQTTPIATKRQPQPVKSEPKQDAPRKTEGGGKVVVVGQGAGRFKLVAGGLLVLLLVVFFIIRNRV